MIDFANGCEIWEGRQVLSLWLRNLIVVVEIRSEGFGLVMKEMANQDSRHCEKLRDLETTRMRISHPVKRSADLSPEWRLTIMCGMHNHSSTENLEAHSYTRGL